MRRLSFFLLLVALVGCGRNMYDQAKLETYDATTLFADSASSRTLPENTVSRGRGEVDEAYFTGQGAEGIATELPFELTEAVLQRGQERYNIYCSPCHNYSGDGQGMIVQKGFVQPTSFHDPRLLASPVGYFYSAATNGFGRMFPYASRIPPEDRWAISAYIKALQYSQSAPIASLPEDLKTDVVAATQAEAQEAAEAARASAEAAAEAAQAAREAAQAVGEAIGGAGGQAPAEGAE